MTELAPSSISAFTGEDSSARADSPRVQALVTTRLNSVVRQTHVLFVRLLIAEAAFAGGIAALYHPSRADIVLAILGSAGLLIAPALALIRFLPEETITRLTVGASQAGLSILVLQLTGGTPAAYLPIFGALAVLALYRDYRVLPVASGIVTAYQLMLAAVAPAWLPLAPGGWLWVAELTAALAFETAALTWLCRVSRREIVESSQRLNQHHLLLDDLERRVVDRTRALEAEMKARERTAEELRHNELHHRNLVANVPIGIFETTRSGRVNFANPYLLSLVGLPTSFDPTAISLSDGQIFSPADRDRLWSRLEKEREVRGFAATFQRFDGSSFDVVINAHIKENEAHSEVICEGTVEDVTARKRAERELNALHGQLVIASRQAGMAEVASGVLHNVGNVLTSVNLIVHDVQDRLKTTRLSHLRRVVEILQREQPRLVEFLTEEGGGRQLPDFLAKLDTHLTTENQQLLTDVEGLVRHFEHIREIIVTQQGSAQLFGVLERLAPAQLFEDALRLNAESLERHGITLERVFDPVGHVTADRHKALQILVNLLKNAKDAVQAVKPGDRVIRVRVATLSETTISLSVEDNGPGILPENLTRIFQHGFTTKPSGHGFGLHSSVLAAREMGGDLIALSPGLGHGSTFRLTLPIATSPAS